MGSVRFTAMSVTNLVSCLTILVAISSPAYAILVEDDRRCPETERELRRASVLAAQRNSLIPDLTIGLPGRRISQESHR